MPECWWRPCHALLPALHKRPTNAPYPLPSTPPSHPQFAIEQARFFDKCNLVGGQDRTSCQVRQGCCWGAAAHRSWAEARWLSDGWRRCCHQPHTTPHPNLTPTGGQGAGQRRLDVSGDGDRAREHRGGPPHRQRHRCVRVEGLPQIRCSNSVEQCGVRWLGARRTRRPGGALRPALPVHLTQRRRPCPPRPALQQTSWWRAASL